MATKFNSKIRPLGLHEQKARLTLLYPDAKVRVGGSKLTWDGWVHPTPRSDKYLVHVDYVYRKHPNVAVIDPKLAVREGEEKIPHMYNQKHLCLYYPGSPDWNSSKPLATTILPWTSLWLYFYEIWRITGVWHGGGIHSE